MGYLEDIASQVGIGQTKAYNVFKQKKADKATEWLANYMDEMQAKASKQSKAGLGTLLSGGVGWLGNLIAPGLGTVLSLIEQAASGAARQSKYKERIKKLKKDISIPSEFKGTFLESGLTQGAMLGQQSAVDYLKGMKSSDLLTGLTSTALSAMPLFKTSGSAQKGLGKLFGPKGAAGKFLEGIIPGGGKGIAKGFSESIFPELFKAGPGEVLSRVERGLQHLTTPATYSNIARKSTMDFLTSGQEEPAVARFEAPPLRRRY